MPSHSPLTLRAPSAELGKLPGEAGFWRFNRIKDYGLKVGAWAAGWGGRRGPLLVGL